MRVRSALLFFAMVFVATACGDKATENEPGATEFVVRGSTSATASGISNVSYTFFPDLRAVDASSFTVKFAEMRVSANVDCTGPYQTIFTRATPTSVDMATSPEIARVTGVPEGNYPCVALKISDIIGYTPASSEGLCSAGTAYTKDIYRAGNEEIPFRDINGAVITATGTDATPSEDIVWALFSTDIAAVTDRGYSPSQVNPLTTPLTIPGSTVFYWAAANSIVSTADECDIQPGVIGFR